MSEKDQLDLPEYWVTRVSKSRNGKTYYFNTKTKQSVWHLSEVRGPNDTSKLTLKNLAKHNSPNDDRKLRKIQNPTSFKRNLAEDRLKHLQNNLKNEQIKTEVIAASKDSSPKKAAKSVKKSIPAENVNNNNRVDKDASALPNKTEHELSKQYTEFITKILASNVTENVENKSPVKVDVSSPVGDSVNQSTVLEDSLDSEPMDWEYTSDDISSVKLNNETKPEINNSENKPVEVSLDTFETMEQYLSYKNLLNDETEMDQKYFYVVVDTNIFLSNLEFIEKLIKIKFKNYGFPAIVVPYQVFQELDKIKCRFESKFTTLSVKAKTAIHYLNEKLKSHHKQFCGQSATEDSEKLIAIATQDDDIVNCLLQVKKKAKGTVILLSNDKNLRNKVLVSGINSYSSVELERNKDSLKFVTPNSL